VEGGSTYVVVGETW